MRMAVPAPPPTLLGGCGLPQQWAHQPAWRVLDTGFAEGANLLHTLQAWQQDPARPRMLHYVALCGSTPPTRQALGDAAGTPALQALAQALAAQWFGLLPGFHRFTLEQGQVLLTLCVGDVQSALREQAFQADAIYLDAAPGDGATAWDIWHFKALARCCRRGTALAARTLALDARKHLAQCGFDVTHEGAEGVQARFNPRWVLKTSRATAPATAIAPGSCTVVGAGLAGASVAAALARRGFQVLVLDAAPHPAAQASGLPVGLMAPQVSADDGVRAQLSRAGLRLSLQQAQALLRQGEDWDLSGVLERRLDSTASLPAGWPAEGLDWSQPYQPQGQPQAWQAQLRTYPATWHPAAAWIKPAALVQAWLSTTGVRFQGNTQVASLEPLGDGWQVLDGQGKALAHSQHVVLASAMGTAALLGTTAAWVPPLAAVHGQVSWGMHRSAAPGLAPFPVNGHGSFIPRVPMGAGHAWYAGATYEPAETPAGTNVQAHQANRDKLAHLLPSGALLMDEAMATAQLQAWRNTRCTSADRLPVVGRLNPATKAGSLWVSTAMGSRGLTHCVLCAELLAAQMCGEPWPLEARLARLLGAQRHLKNA